LQTVPSLALLGFLLILFGGTIGKPPALAALVIYALLPIIKNTILGLRGVDPGVLEAAVGMGMTGRQRLFLVELPLAVPVLLGGVRLATVASVGMATIAAAIGAKGLGSYIFRGVALSDSRLILLGAIPAAVLALACDWALGEVERMLDLSKPGRSRLRNSVAVVAVVPLAALAIWGAGIDLASRFGEKKVVIGSKDGTEMILLGHMLADLVETETGLPVDRRFNLSGTLVCYNALKEGGLDGYVEYTGTALTTILKEPPDNDPGRVYQKVKTRLEREAGITSLDPLGFENTFAILVRRDEAQRLKLRTISDLTGHASRLRAGFGPEFMNRADGYPGLARAYGLRFAESPREMDRNLLYQAVAQGSIDVAAGDSTDGRIASLDLVVLDDDRRYFPPYEAVPLVRSETLRRHPRLRSALNSLAGKITADTMRRLNFEVDTRRRDPQTVAREFVRSLQTVP
jgi:osmoprotectant transport system permease protein